jgi:exonuclease III
VTLNVDTLTKEKLNDFVSLVSSIQADVLLLQETMRVPESTQTKHFIHGYRIIEQPARATEQQGARGLAIVFRESLSFAPMVNMSNDFCLVSVARVGAVTLRVASVYCPSRIQKRPTPLAAVKLSMQMLRNNMNADKLSSFLNVDLNCPTLTVLPYATASAPFFTVGPPRLSTTLLPTALSLPASPPRLR